MRVSCLYIFPGQTCLYSWGCRDKAISQRDTKYPHASVFKLSQGKESTKTLSREGQFVLILGTRWWPKINRLGNIVEAVMPLSQLIEDGALISA